MGLAEQAPDILVKQQVEFFASYVRGGMCLQRIKFLKLSVDGYENGAKFKYGKITFVLTIVTIVKRE